MPGLPHSSDTRARVIEEFKTCGRVDLACERAGVDRSCHYDWLGKHQDYREAYEAAIAPVARMLEDVAVCRAVEGWEEQTFNGGKVVKVRKFDNRLLEFLLQARNSKVFGRKQEVTGKDGAPLLGDIDAAIKLFRNGD